jgi:hypothetical protein
MPKYVFATCERYNTFRHGIPDINSAQNILDHYLILDIHNTFHSYMLALFHILRQHQHNNTRIIRPFNARLEIVEPILLEGGETVAILKTYLLRIVQRTWKRIYKDRQKRKTYLKRTKNLLNREIGIFIPQN